MIAAEAEAPAIGTYELPPPYSSTVPGSVPTINCKVCQSLVNIEGRTQQHVVKCSICKEATVCMHPSGYTMPDKMYLVAIIYTIILLMDSVPHLTSVVLIFWSLQTEFWADRFAKCLKMFHLTYFLYYKVLAL